MSDLPEDVYLYKFLRPFLLQMDYEDIRKAMKQSVEKNRLTRFQVRNIMHHLSRDEDHLGGESSNDRT